MKFRLWRMLLLVVLLVFMSGCGDEFAEDDDNFADESQSKPYFEDDEDTDFDEEEEESDPGNPDDDAHDEDEGSHADELESDDPEDTAVSNDPVANNPTPQPISVDNGELNDVFVKGVDVFGVKVWATERMSDAQLHHVATVMAEYLDNDEDGRPDDPKLVDTLIKRQAVMMVLFDENEAEQFDPEMLPNPDAGQVVLDVDIRPGRSAQGEFDATLEEVLHLISFAGLAYTYPDVFGEHPGTAVAEAMDIARGAYFTDVPRQYPDGAWYTYDDETCEYNCMVSEYFYWALTSILGGQDFNGRLDEIGHEWPLNTRSKVQSGDPTIYALLTDSTHQLPTVLPDGDYDALPIEIYSR